MNNPATSRRAIAALALLAGSLAGCTNPLWREGKDLGQRVPLERLRRIEVAPLDQLAKPASDPTQTPPTKDRFVGLATAPLTLEEARASALERNLDLKVQLVNPEIAAENIRQERARFEALFTTRALWSETDSPTASTLASAQQKLGQIEPGVRIPLRTGGTANVSLPVARTETNNQFSTLNPAFTSDLAFSISQPLLRDAGVDVNETSIRVAGYNQQISEAQAKLAVINQLAAVDRAYWRLYQAKRDLDVRQQQFDLASDQLARAQRQQAAGRVAEIEVVRAQAGVAQRLEAIITAQRSVLEQQRELKRLINRADLPVDAQTLIEPQTPPRPVEYLFDDAAKESLLSTAEQSRMELLELELRLLADAAQVRFAENQTNPRLDLDATYRINGLGASSQDSFKTLQRNQFEDWSIGANLEVPLGNEGANSRLREAVLTRLQRLSSKESRQQSVRQDVLDAIDRIDAAWQSILATRQSTILSTRTLQAEQRQFDVGQSTSTQVLDAATRLAESQLAEIRAIVDYQLAQVELATATGTMLGASSVEWQPRAADAPQN
jgi:outer membrane protein